jgi:hypothetical protein
MVGMDIHIMGMVVDTMEVVATIVHLTIDLQTDLTDQDLNILSIDRIDQRQSHQDQQQGHLWADQQQGL